ncbi:MAG: response regulator transcription factor [Nitrospira sp. LK70]|nr:response regulator transcription factor [Nitrospira sp. LK70]
MMIPSQDIRIAIVHRDGLYRDCLCHSLAQTQPISIVHSASVLDKTTWDTVVAHRPAILILEFGLCRCQGPAQSGKGMYSSSLGVKTIMIGVPDKEEDILACIEGVGAAGYLLMDASLEDLIQNIRAVMKGETLCSPRVASLTFDRVSVLARQVGTARAPTPVGMGLTRREAEIVRLIEVGLSNKEIAVRLHIEVSTVKNHVHNILDKLQLHNRHSAVNYIKEQGATGPRF